MSLPFILSPEINDSVCRGHSEGFLDLEAEAVKGTESSGYLDKKRPWRQPRVSSVSDPCDRYLSRSIFMVYRLLSCSSLVTIK